MFNMSHDNQKKSFWLGFAAGVAVLVVLGGVYMLGAKGNGLSFNSDKSDKVAAPTPTAAVPEEAAPDVTKVTVGKDEPVRGSKNAKLTMIEFSDFECPFCSRFTATVDQILETYDGQVNLVYKNFPLRSLHASAQKAAEAVECAGDQGKFWEMHDKLFELSAAQNLSLETIKSGAAAIGLNTGEFNSCLDNGDKTAKVEADYQMGIAAGVTGTPGTFIGTQFVPGALTFDQVKTLIDSQL